MSTPYQPVGKTITFTADTAAPTPVQAPATGSALTTKYRITNVGTVTAFVGWGATAALATANSVTPTGTSQNSFPVSPASTVVVGAPPNAFFTGTASAAAILYVTPVEGG